MINPFLNGYRPLLDSWKELRHDVENTPDDDQALIKIVQFWSLAPLSKRILDWDDPANWPTPWEMIHANTFDESSVSLMIFYTLVMINGNRFANGRSRLALIKDMDRQIQRVVVLMDSFILNLEYNTVIDMATNRNSLIVQQIYDYDGRVHSMRQFRIQNTG